MNAVKRGVFIVLIWRTPGRIGRAMEFCNFTGKYTACGVA